MKETRTFRVTMSEETWRIFDVYQKLLDMKIRRKGARMAGSCSIVSAILAYFLKRHGPEIVSAYTEAKIRRQRGKFNRIFSVEGMDITLDAPTPLYPVSNEEYRWDKRYRKTPPDPVLQYQQRKNRQLNISKPAIRRGRSPTARSGRQP